MKKYIIILLTGTLLFSSCNDWLDILPKNEQVTEKYWQSKEDVEQVVAAGYYYMRQTTPYLIDWGEIRGASIFAPTDPEKGKLQDFQMVATSDLCKWEKFYQVINMANSVLEYAPQVLAIDNTYTMEAMRSHQTEAYFMRALMYFTLVRNFKEVPLALSAYVDDSAPYVLPKSTEEVVIQQIKDDITTALASGAAKEFFTNSGWSNATKGRATRWALMALMADVCLWSEDYDGCINYVNQLLEADSPYRPAFMTDKSQWFDMFFIGNSNESAFEINWDTENFAQSNFSPSLYYASADASTYQFTDEMYSRLIIENAWAERNGGAVRGAAATYYNRFLWKYVGSQSGGVYRSTTDANLIIYRMADLMLMKAEALIWKGETYFQAALDIINTIRERANVNLLDLEISEETEQSMLHYVLEERDMELAGENKRWYDLVRFGRGKNFKYQTDFISLISENNQTASISWLRSVLQNENAWFLPINAKELEVNELLEQNPYYKSTN